jgi:XRE family transcriptional regulator of biofilm formation
MTEQAISTEEARALGKRLIDLRKKKGWSLRELGLRADIAHTYVSRIERGEIPGIGIRTLEKLATALGVTRDALLGEGTESDWERGLNYLSVATGIDVAQLAMTIRTYEDLHTHNRTIWTRIADVLLDAQKAR